MLAESRARAYFPFTDISKAIGQAIVYNDSIKAIVTGIVRDLDDDEVTDLTFKEFVSLQTFIPILKADHGYDTWHSFSTASQFYIKLQKNANVAQVQKQINLAREKAAGKQFMKSDNYLQPLKDIHFNPKYDNYNEHMGNKTTLYGLIAVAAFLLLLGCINFINLTTAQASRRAREIGIRKTMGSSLWQLLSQFLGETFLLTLIATCLSVIMTPLLLKVFKGYIPDGVSFNLIRQPDIFLFLALLIILVSLLSGIYPALILSRYQPAMVLKNVSLAGSGKGQKAWLRKILTVLQFTIAQFFIIATLMVGKQIKYSLNLDMGFKKDAIISFNVPFDFSHPDNKQLVLQQKLKGIPGIQKISLAGSPPAWQGIMISTFDFNNDGKKIQTTFEVKYADTNYLNLYGLKLLAGRGLRQSDSSIEYLVTESCAKFLGYARPSDIVGKYFEKGNSGKSPIVGVVADFHSKSVTSAIVPIVFTCNQKYHEVFNILLAPKGENTDGWKKTISRIESAWKQIYPEQDFKYNFVDEIIAKFYEDEQKLSGLLNWCTGLSVFISCLGLLGLVIYTTNQRTKEIGVRKVLGASASQIIALLSKDFMQWVVLAFIIAAPLSWWALHKWLQNYAYRTAESWWVFALSGMGMLCLALLTLSIQTIRSANANPVDSLRTE